jgi:hypothetical protein
MKNTWKPTCGGYIPSDNDNIVDMKTENKSFPTREEFSKICFDLFTYLNRTQADEIYNYFTQFAVREVFPEVGKVYEFSNDNRYWTKKELEAISYDTYIGSFVRIRPIQSSRLDELKARKSELSKDELLELIELMETTP